MDFLDYFHFSAIVNDAAMNMDVPTSQHPLYLPLHLFIPSDGKPTQYSAATKSGFSDNPGFIPFFLLSPKAAEKSQKFQ